MALTITTDSINYQGSKSPIGFKLTTDKHLLSFGIKSISTVYIVANPLITDYLEFYFLDSANYFRVNFATTLNDEGTNVRTNVSSLSLPDYAVQLMADLQRIYVLNHRYDFSVVGQDILLTAKNVGANTGTQPSPLSTIFPRVYFDNTAAAGADDVYNENFSALAEVLIETTKNSGVFERVNTLESHPFANVCKFDLSETLDAYLKVSKPNIDTNGAEIVPESLKRYYLIYFEKYGTPAIEKVTSQTPTNGLVLKGGISYLNWEGTNAKIVDNLRDNGLYISNKSYTRVVKKSQPEFIAFIINNNSASVAWQIRLLVVLHYTDNTNSSHIMGAAWVLSSFLVNDVLRFSTGYDQLDIDGLKTSGKTVKKYTVEVIANDGATTTGSITEQITYIVNESSELDTHYYLFQNSLGDFDTLCCTGEQIIVPNIEREIAEIATDYEHLPTDFNAINFSNTEIVTKKQLSGYQRKADIEWFKEFFLSTQHYEYLNGKLIPIILKSNSFEKFRSQQTLNTFEFEFYQAFKDNN